jgi:integrase
MPTHQLITEPELRKYKTYWLIEYYQLDQGGKKIYPAVRQTFDINREKDLAKREELAQSYINQIRAKFKLKIDTITPDSSITIMQALAEIKTIMKSATNKQKTKEDVDTFCNRFEPFLLKYKLDKLLAIDIAENHIHSFFDYLIAHCRNRKGEPLKGRTLNNYRGRGVWIFNYLLDRKYVKENHFLSKKEYKEGNKQSRNYENEELSILFDSVAEKDPLAFFAMMLVYRCAIRSKEELLTLKPNCFDFAKQLIRIEGSISKTNEADQFVTIPDDLVDYFKDFTKHIPKNWYIFGAGKGLKPQKEKHCGRNAIYNRFRKYLLKLDEQGEINAEGLTMYRLKHKGSQDLLEAGVNVLAISKHLRHKNVRTTEIYLDMEYKVNTAIKLTSIGPDLKKPTTRHE